EALIRITVELLQCSQPKEDSTHTSSCTETTPTVIQSASKCWRRLVQLLILAQLTRFENESNKRSSVTWRRTRKFISYRVVDTPLQVRRLLKMLEFQRSVPKTLTKY